MTNQNTNLPLLQPPVLKRLLLIMGILWALPSVAQLPVPDFSATPLSGCAPLEVNFTNLSTGARSQQWDLGNGVTSTQANPSTLYTTPGVYTVTLTVTNENGSQTLTRTNYITVFANPAPEFSVNNQSGCFPLRASFQDLSTTGSGSLVSWNWSFGNGATSTQQNPLYTYTTSGSYFVSLTVTNSDGCSRTIVKPGFINVSTGVQAAFNFSTPQTCRPPDTIRFQNLSTGPGTVTYQWNFGDGNTSTATNPSHEYTTAGPFSVQLIATSSQGCVDTLVRSNIIQLNNVQTGITAPATGCVGQAINFQNSSTPLPQAANWSFGDATGSTLVNPIKTFTSAGVYQVRLRNQYATCSDSAFHTITIQPKPRARFTSTDSISCRAPHTVQFIDQSTDAVAWLWDFGDGNTSTTQQPSHTYTALGNYTVQLIVTNSFGCTDTLVRPAFVRLQRPVIAPVFSPTEGCTPLTVQFTANASSLDTVTTWFWDFGNGNTSTLTNPSNTFDSGTYSIKLRVTTRLGCIDSIVLNNAIRVGVRPRADFSAAPLQACAFATVQFTDASTGNPDEWLWSFGDNTGSSQQNPVHTYTDTGWRSVQLIVFNNRCPDTLIRQQYIRVLPPIARFTSAVNCTINKRQVRFTDQSVNATGWLWDFGDGNTSTAQNPVHTYANFGTYTVRLTTTNGACTHQVTNTVTLVDPIPAFTANPTTACRRNQPVNFINQSTEQASIVSYLWEFGDGNTSSQQNPQHIYQNAGNYTVTLRITDINGCTNLVTQPNAIRVNGPVAAFSLPATVHCVNTPLSFANNATSDGQHPITSVEWNMGNGDVLTGNTNPFIYSYPAGGTFTVTQTVRDASGCTDVFTLNNLRILDPRARFTVDTPTCPGSTLTINNLSTGSGSQTYSWLFSDGFTSTATNPVHAFAATGLYTIQLVAAEAIGCRDTLRQTVRVDRPRASFTVNDTFSICQPFEARFTSTSTFVNAHAWNFGNGGTSTAANPTQFYITPGSYRVRLTVTSPGGCVDSSFTTIRVAPPTGTLSYAPLSGCAPIQVSLRASTLVPLQYTWDFGDGNITTTTDSNRVHVYDAGFYVPKVVIRDGAGCIGIIQGVDTVRAFGSRPDFGADRVLLCDSGLVQFSDSTITRDVITGYLWNFGDGNTSVLPNPSHRYTSPGLYTVSLRISTQSGCVNTRTKTNLVKVVPSPQVQIAGAVSACIPAQFNLSGNWLNPDTSTISWQWNIDGQLFNGQQPPPVVRSAADTVFIRLIAINGSGCRDTVNQLAIARPLPAVLASNDTTICLGTQANLRASGADSYRWAPATFLNCTNCSSPQAAATDAIMYTVTGTSAFGCVNTDSVIVRVKKPFRITASTGDTLCVGDRTNLFASGAELYQWSPASGLSSTVIANPVASPTTTTVYQVTGYDSLNCFRDSLLIPIVVYNYPVITTRSFTIQAGDTIPLNPGFSPDVTTALWLNGSNLSCTRCLVPLAWPRQNTTYTVRASNLGGCDAAASIRVNVTCGKENVFVPNAFTPNGDGLNDRFTISGKGLQSIQFLRIYNRWGNLAFEKTFFEAGNPSLGWNGQLNGQDAPPGVYTFSAQVICGDGSLIPVNGQIILIR